MLKKYIYGGVFALVCIGLLLLILLKRFDKITPIEVLQSVPQDAVLFIEGLDYEYLTESFLPRSRIWTDFVNTTSRHDLDSLLTGLLATVRSSETIRELLDKEGLNLSVHLQGKDKLVSIFYLHYGESATDHEFEQEILDVLGDEAMVNERKYEGEMIYEISAQPGFVPGKFSFSCVQGICLLSSTSMLIEEAIRNIHADVDLSMEEGLMKVRETAGKYVHGNLYINYNRLEQLFYPLVNQNSWDRLKAMSELALWGELDMDVKEDAVILNGMSLAGGEGKKLLNAFDGQDPVKMELQEVLPSGTSYFLHFGISDPAAFLEHLKGYYSQMDQLDAITAESERIQKAYGIDPLGDLAGILDNELAWFSIEGETESRSDEVLVIETRGKSEAQEVVMRWIDRYLEVNSFDMSSYRYEYQLDNQTKFNIYRLPDPFYKELIPGRLFNKYFTFYENYLLFGPSVEVLSRIIYQNVLHKTFVSDPGYKEMSDYFSNRSNLSIFLRPFPFLEYNRELLSGSFEQHLPSMEIFLRRIPGLVVQYNAEGKLYYQNVSLRYTSQIREKALTVWESLLDSVADMKPALVTNHNTSEKEIFIQDRANWIYLINSTGRILWKERLEGPILGDVHQVDFYRNGKLQYLFNTAGKIHLIDRNGNYVERYPIVLRSRATNPVALFDYDNNGNYRLFVAGEDRKIYVYGIEGNIVTGWNFGKSESEIIKPVQHFRIGDRDFIVASDRNRVYLLDRRGKERVRLKDQVALSENNPIVLDMNIREEKPRWVGTDTTGTVKAIYLNGTVSTLLDHRASPGHFFRMVDMDRDGIPEFIFADGNELKVLHQDGKQLFGFKVRDRISNMPDIYKFSASDVKIGITDTPRNRIYLINPDGSLYEGFPLEGSTRFSIGYFAGSDSRFNLIVGSTNNFLYNYSIE